jgi:hypothetical protein
MQAARDGSLATSVAAMRRFACFGDVVELSGGTFRAELHDVVANAEHAVGLHTDVGERDGRRLNVRKVLVSHLREGKAVQVWEHNHNSQAYGAFSA